VFPEMLLIPTADALPYVFVTTERNEFRGYNCIHGRSVANVRKNETDGYIGRTRDNHKVAFDIRINRNPWALVCDWSTEA
jgi:hypothetical protein